ncbi:hypothetical protein HN51_011022 [Arachis hypogaea]
MTRTKNAKRAKVEGESYASARLVASSHYMARWLLSPRALNNYVEKFEAIYSIYIMLFLKLMKRVRKWEEIRMPKNLRSKDNHKTLKCKYNPRKPYHHRLLR